MIAFKPTTKYCNNRTTPTKDDKNEKEEQENNSI
jgi:hypothetical protein